MRDREGLPPSQRCFLPLTRRINYHKSSKKARHGLSSLISSHRHRFFLLLAILLLCILTPLHAAYSYYRSIINERHITSVSTSIEHKFTIVILSQPRRVKTLRTVVSHFGHCPSVHEIVVVWGGGPLPDLNLFESQAPVRFRNEQFDSLNNRFKPDPQIDTEAIFSLDDDTLMWCSDLEAGFKEWQRQPDKLVGFFPRLIEIPENSNLASYYGEKTAYKRGEYNAMLTVGMFYNADLMAEYWRSNGLGAFGRTIVDTMFNCEDILMNYVAAAAIEKKRTINEGSRRAGEELLPAVAYVRARRRLDLSQLTSVGISHSGAEHLAKRNNCSAQFAKYVHENKLLGGAAELPRAKFDWRQQRAGRPICWLPGLGCVYF